MANYNLTRHVDDLLEVTQKPSPVLHRLNNAGAKFAYNHQVAVCHFPAYYPL